MDVVVRVSKGYFIPTGAKRGDDASFVIKRNNENIIITEADVEIEVDNMCYEKKPEGPRVELECSKGTFIVYVSSDGLGAKLIMKRLTT